MGRPGPGFDDSLAANAFLGASALATGADTDRRSSRAIDLARGLPEAASTDATPGRTIAQEDDRPTMVDEARGGRRLAAKLPQGLRRRELRGQTPVEAIPKVPTTADHPKTYGPRQTTGPSN